MDIVGAKADSNIHDVQGCSRSQCGLESHNNTFVIVVKTENFKAVDQSIPGAPGNCMRDKMFLQIFLQLKLVILFSYSVPAAQTTIKLCKHHTTLTSVEVSLDSSITKMKWCNSIE